MTDKRSADSREIESVLSRREFVQRVTGVAVAGGILPAVADGIARADGPKAATSTPSDTAVKRFYDSLTEPQKKVICFPYDHPLRSKVNANWAITEPTIEDLFTKDQQAILDDVFKGVVSPDGYDRLKVQMEEDDAGFGNYHVAVFGTPGTGQFQWELTGRHVTLRADGDHDGKTAFGGPMIYGHGAGESQKGLPGNVFYYQTRKANEVFKALDGKQRGLALQPKAPGESAVKVQGATGKFAGITVGDLSTDQKGLVESVMKVILAPYREADVDEALAVLKAGGGLDALHMAFYESDDIGKDQEWDIWRLEGPSFVWHFRGAPHVHAYVNISQKA